MIKNMYKGEDSSEGVDFMGIRDCMFAEIRASCDISRDARQPSCNLQVWTLNWTRKVHVLSGCDDCR